MKTYRNVFHTKSEDGEPPEEVVIEWQRGFRIIGLPKHNIRVIVNKKVVAQYDNWKELKKALNKEKGKEITLQGGRPLKINNPMLIKLGDEDIIGKVDPKEKMDTVGGALVWFALFGALSLLLNLSAPVDQRATDQLFLVQIVLFGLTGPAIRTHSRIGMVGTLMSFLIFGSQILWFYFTTSLAGGIFWFSVALNLLGVSFYWRGTMGSWELLKQRSRTQTA